MIPHRKDMVFALISTSTSKTDWRSHTRQIFFSPEVVSRIPSREVLAMHGGGLGRLKTLCTQSFHPTSFSNFTP